jgi:hypothetical protein
MKNILFYFIIVLAMFSPNVLCARGAEHELGIKTDQQVYYAFDYRQPSKDNLCFDVCLEDICDDDLTDSEGKKPSSDNASAYNLSFVTQNYIENNFNTIFLANLFFPSRTPLFILICVIRI